LYQCINHHAAAVSSLAMMFMLGTEINSINNKRADGTREREERKRGGGRVGETERDSGVDREKGSLINRIIQIKADKGTNKQ